MELTGIIARDLGEKSGISANGKNWKVKQFVLETQEQYPKHMLFEVFGEEKISSMNIRIGETLKVYFDIDAREHQGKWYNSIRAWKVDRMHADTGLPNTQLNPIIMPESDVVFDFSQSGENAPF